jgi:hypothetical protein
MGGMRNVHRTLSRVSEGKRPLLRPRTVVKVISK